jgi:hypothetical protein
VLLFHGRAEELQVQSQRELESDGKFSPFIYGTGMSAPEVEISDDVFIIRKETADAYKKSSESRTSSEKMHGATDTGGLGGKSEEEHTRDREDESARAQRVQTDFFFPYSMDRRGSTQKWMNFYTKVVSKFAPPRGVKLPVTFEAAPEGEVSKQKVEEVKAALRELGLDPEIKQ